MRATVSTDSIRSVFSDALAAMYREEVPLYKELTEIVGDVDAEFMRRQDALGGFVPKGTKSRIASERHGAIRLGTAEELSSLARIFRAMGMAPVGYYDLSAAGVPVHSTAFRPTTSAALEACPFRVFTSLLRLELIDDDDLRQRARVILASRKILSDRALELADVSEAAGGLVQGEADEFVAEVMETFRWRRTAIVDAETYNRLRDAHRLVADVVSFRGPHINHLTPRTLDIDAVHAEMHRRGMKTKDSIEGPPRRGTPILLRQTSFNALEEHIRFIGDESDAGAHTARFGEVEQRGAALTKTGRDLYDTLLAEARRPDEARRTSPQRRLEEVFARFPDDLGSLRESGLAFFNYRLTPRGATLSESASGDLEDWLAAGLVEAAPITYEDFLPVSAAGIFQSNLGNEEQRSYDLASSQAAFERALGSPVADPFALYEQVEADSKRAVAARLQAVAA